MAPESKARIERAAADSGRSMSQEIELRLEQSFERETQAQHFSDLYFGRELAALLEVIGRAMRDAGAHAAAQSARKGGGSFNWLDNPYGFDIAMRSLVSVLDKLRPPGLIQIPPGLPEAERRLAEAIANALLNDLAHELSEGDFMEEWARGLRTRLGRLRGRLEGFDYDIGARSVALPSAHAPGVLLYDSEEEANLREGEGDQHG
jgi:hypothetical protein